MAQSYSEIYFHGVTAVKYRRALIDPDWELRLYGYIREKLLEGECSPIAVGGVADHIHVLWCHPRTRTAAEVMQAIKGASARQVNILGLTEIPFHWQSGYGLFSVSRFRVQLVKSYIERQRAIHQERTFRKEYQRMLLRDLVNDPDRYLFHPPLDESHPQAA